MCYSLHATVASWWLGTHELVWTLVWVSVTDAYSAVDRVAVIGTVCWIYFALLIQIVDFGAWLALLRQPDAVASLEAKPIAGTGGLVKAGLFLHMAQPLAAAIAPTAVAYAAAESWRGGALVATIAIGVVAIGYAVAHASTLAPHQRLFYGSRHAGLAHRWWDEPYGWAGKRIVPHLVYNAAQVAASALQIVVAAISLAGRGRSQVVVLVATGLFWATYVVAFGLSKPPTASRISTVWCWFVGAGLFIAAALALWDAGGEHAIHVATAFASTAVVYGTVRTREESMAHAHAHGAAEGTEGTNGTDGGERPLLSL